VVKAEFSANVTEGRNGKKQQECNSLEHVKATAKTNSHCGREVNPALIWRALNFTAPPYPRRAASPQPAGAQARQNKSYSTQPRHSSQGSMDRFPE
jgi:hypothetical protein